MGRGLRQEGGVTPFVLVLSKDYAIIIISKFI
jgi:hypothetical protein